MNNRKKAEGQHISDDGCSKTVNKLRIAVYILAAAVVILVIIIVFLLAGNSQVPKAEPVIESSIESDLPIHPQDDEAVSVQSEETPAEAVPEEAPEQIVAGSPVEAVPEETPEQIAAGPPVPLTRASQLTDEALELMKSKTLECIRQEEAGWYDGNEIESADYLGRVCLIRKDETAPYDNECNIIYKINMVSRSGSSSVNFSYYYPVSFTNLQVYPDNRCEVDLDSCIKPHFFRAIGLVFYGIETFNQLDREYITGKSYGWTMDSDVTLN